MQHDCKIETFPHYFQSQDFTFFSKLCSQMRPAKHFLVSTGHDKTVRLFDIESVACIYTLLGHTQWVFSLLKHQDNFVLSGGRDKLINIWNVKTQCLYKNIKTTIAIRDMALYGSDRVIIGGLPSNICIVNLTTGKTEKSLHEFTSIVSNVLVHNDTLIAGCANEPLTLWNLKNFSIVKQVPTSSWIKTMEHYIPGESCVVSSNDKSVRLWNLEKSSNDKIHNEHVYSIVCDPSKNSVLLGTGQGTIEHLDLRSKKIVSTLQCSPIECDVLSIKKHGDFDLFVSCAASDPIVKRFDMRKGDKAVTGYAGHVGDVTRICIV